MKRTCRDCKGEIQSTTENHRYVESGLPNVVLLGVEVRRCASCGATELVLPRVLELHRTLARAIVHKPARLSGAEVRFLRKHMGWSGVDFAGHVGVEPETVSRWENETAPISPQSDRLLRMIVVHESPIDDYQVNDLANIANREDPPISVKVRQQRDRHWGVEAQP